MKHWNRDKRSEFTSIPMIICQNIEVYKFDIGARLLHYDSTYTLEGMDGQDLDDLDVFSVGAE